MLCRLVQQQPHPSACARSPLSRTPQPWAAGLQTIAAYPDPYQVRASSEATLQQFGPECGAIATALVPALFEVSGIAVDLSWARDILPLRELAR